MSQLPDFMNHEDRCASCGLRFVPVDVVEEMVKLLQEYEARLAKLGEQGPQESK